jgi:hypothetical protein
MAELMGGGPGRGKRRGVLCRSEHGSVLHPYGVWAGVVAVVLPALSQIGDEPEIEPLVEDFVVDDGVDFKTDARLGEPDAVDFLEDLPELFPGTGALAKVDPESNPIDRDSGCRVFLPRPLDRADSLKNSCHE